MSEHAVSLKDFHFLCQIFYQRQNKQKILSWKKTLQIGSEIARSLAYFENTAGGGVVCEMNLAC